MIIIDIAFVILHYMNIETTKLCVEYIEKNCDTPKYHIVIIDNGSTNNTYDSLEQLYSDNSKITTIRSCKNVGFACGNNIGYRYVKDMFKPNYLIMINSDAYLTEKELLLKLDKEFQESGFFVAGPMIYGVDGNNATNPNGTYIESLKTCRYCIKKAKIDLFFSKLHIYKLLCIFRRHILVTRKKPVGFILPVSEKDRHKLPLYKNYNLPLHGSCLIFSKEYLEKYDGLDERTFLYGEESLLHLHMIIDGRKMVYMPEISVLHVGSASSSYECDDNSKRIKSCTYSIQSYRIIKKNIIEFKKLHNGKEPGEWFLERAK